MKRSNANTGDDIDRLEPADRALLRKQARYLLSEEYTVKEVATMLGLKPMNVSSYKYRLTEKGAAAAQRFRNKRKTTGKRADRPKRSD